MNNNYPKKGLYHLNKQAVAMKSSVTIHLFTAVFIVLALFARSNDVHAQDPHFTQFYAAPLYLNPAFAGSTGEGRMAVNYRHQWPGLDASFVTYAASYDRFIKKHKSGVGLLIKKDDQGANAGSPITSMDATAVYSYHIPLNKEFALKAGLSLGYGIRSLNFTGFIFGDQLTQLPGNLNPTAESLAAENKGFFDVGSGVVLFSENMWLGFSAAHMNQPDISFLGGGDPLPRKISFHGGYKISLNTYRFSKNSRARQPERSIMPAFMYISQGTSSQLSLGAYTILDPLILGFWYRGIPLKKTETPGINQDALSFLSGFRLGNLSIGYSYDYTVSTLSNIGSAGSHEISLTLHMKTGKFKNKNGRPFGYPQVVCPNPWKNRQSLKYNHNR